MLLPVSAVIPTLDRRGRLQRTVAGLLAQDRRPSEIIIIDASDAPVTAADLPPPSAGVRLLCQPASQRGAAAQRNQGVALATQPHVLFMDDDVDLQPGCIATLWSALQSNPRLGAAGAVLSNQHYHPPGRGLRFIYRLLGCPADGSLAAQFCGPALNFLPAPDSPTGAAEWLNLCCTLCRGEALPRPPLLSFFTGYSLLEDAALTAQMHRRWDLVALPAAVYHDYRPAAYKDRVFARERMEMTNRWFVMTNILQRRHPGWALRFACYQLLMLLLLLLRADRWGQFPAAAAGKIAGAWKIAIHSRRWKGYPS